MHVVRDTLSLYYLLQHRIKKLFKDLIRKEKQSASINLCESTESSTMQQLIRLLRVKLITAFGILTIFSMHPPAPAQEYLAEPARKGEYFVCPNGRVLEQNFEGYRRKDNSDPPSLSAMHPFWDKVVDVNGEFIIAKSNNFPSSRDEILRLSEKLLEGINVPSSYKLKEFMQNGYHAVGRNHKYSAKNYVDYLFTNSGSQRVILGISRDLVYEVRDIDKGKNYRARTSSYESSLIKTLRCEKDFALYKKVYSFRLNDATNQYGERVKRPIMYVLLNYTLKTTVLPEKNTDAF